MTAFSTGNKNLQPLNYSLGKLRIILRCCLCIVSIFLLCSSSLPAQEAHGFEEYLRSRTSRSYIPELEDGYGVAFRDVNNDQLPDIYFIRYFGDNHLLINNGAYRPFKDATALAGLSGNPRPAGVYKVIAAETTFDLKFGTAIVDIDNDSDGDLIIAGWRIATALYRNDDNLTFTNISDRMNIFPPISANAVVAADINNDGLVDLFLSDEHNPNHMLLNTDDGYFEDVTESSGLNANTMSRGASFCDIDNDGDQDLYVTNWDQPDDLFLNDGSGKFIRQNTLLLSCKESWQTGSVSFADLDNNGWFDIVLSRIDGPAMIYLNDSLLFKPVELSDNIHTLGSTIADFNNDGFLDIFFTAQGINKLYISPFSAQPKIINEADKFDRIQSTGSACADFDLDGDIDLIVASRNSAAIFYQNHANNDSFIKFKLNGIRSNRDAIGARIFLYRPNYAGVDSQLIATREISGGGGMYSFSDPIIHFGIDTNRVVDAVIHFPSGKTIIENNLSAGTMYEIYEYDLFMRHTILFFIDLSKRIRQIEFWYQVSLVLLFLVMTFIFIRLGLRRYRWSAGAASGYLIGFFLLAIVAFTVLKSIGLLTIFLVVDILIIVFVAVMVINSERYYRLRKIREKYRSVLLNLSNRIVGIHDNEKLFLTVRENIHQNSDFDQIALYLINSDANQYQLFLENETYGDYQKISDIPEFAEFLNLLKSEKFLRRQDHKDITPVFEYFHTQNITAIERNEHIYGMITLGASESISPLSKEDTDLFKFIGNQMAIAMENNEYLQKSTEMIKKLTAAEVREQYLKELEKTNSELDTKNRDLQKLYDELKNTQTQLIHSEKMASLGQLVAGISHELNNPIGFIYSNARQLKTYTTRIEKFIHDYDLDESHKAASRLNIEELLPDLKSLINDTISGSQMVKEIVDNLRNFSHLDEARWKTVDIHSGIESSIKIMLPQFKRQLTIHRDFKATGIISCNPGQMNQVFLNILSNAAQAIENSGNIWIKTRDENGWLIIEFTDDGKGMPEKILDKIFDPFYTTKDVGEGTGLGLSISYSIIQNHHGKITATSKLNSGSTFSIRIPYNQESE